MFDDQPIQTPGQPPKNLPVGEPEDIFSNTDNEAPLTEPTEVPASSIAVPEPRVTKTAESSAVAAGVLKPKVPDLAQEPSEFSKTVVAPPPANFLDLEKESVKAPELTKTQPPSPMMSDHDYQIKKPRLGKILFTIIAVLVFGTLFVYGAWWGYSNFIDVESAEDEITTSDSALEDFTDIQEFQDRETENQFDSETVTNPELTDDTILFGQPIDSDADGLDDIREEDINTDPDNWDTDNDGLSDGDEVIIWKTDPLNPDTDGDGYLDGGEVKSGYSPNGSGKIFEPPEENITSVNFEISTDTERTDLY